jgi:hypothetical protein
MPKGLIKPKGVEVLGGRKELLQSFIGFIPQNL